jgi:hypothetical protein
MRNRLSLLVVLTFILMPNPVAAAGANCRCLYQGKYFDHGDTVCIRVDGRTKLARCDMVLNNSSWKFVQDGCPSASATPLGPEAMALIEQAAFKTVLPSN